MTLPVGALTKDKQRKVVGYSPLGGELYENTTGYDRQSDDVTMNYSKSDQPAPAHIITEFVNPNGTTDEWPIFSGSMQLFAHVNSEFDGRELRTFIMFDDSDQPGSAIYDIGIHSRLRNGFRPGCINRITFYASAQGIMIDGNLQSDPALDNQWIWLSITDDTSVSSSFQVALKVGNGDSFMKFDDDEYKISNRALDLTATILDGDYDFRVETNIASLRNSRSLRYVEVKNGYTSSDGIPMARVTLEMAVSGFAKGLYLSCEPYSLAENAIPTLVGNPLRIYRDQTLTGAMISSLPLIQAGQQIEGAFTDGLSDVAALQALRMDNLAAKDVSIEKDIADLKAKLAAGGLNADETKKINDDIAALEAEQAAAKKEIDDLEKATRKHLTTRRAKIAPMPFLRNHGQVIKSTDGSILVDEGKVWAKTVTNAIDLPNMSYATSTITKGKAWVAVWADKSGNATLDILGQPQGGNIGTDRQKLIDGAWTVYRKDFNVPTNNINTFFSWSLQAPAGDIQGPVFYELGKEELAYGPYNYYGTFENEDGTTQQRELIDSERIAAIEASFNSLSTVKAIGGSTRFAGLPFIIAPDRMGARADVLAFTFGDNRRTTSGKMEYPARVTGVSLPVSAVKSNTPPTDWTAASRTINGENLNAFKRTFNLKDTPTGPNAFYDLWVSWKRNGTTYEFWFESLHSNSVTLGEVKDISVSYVKDDTAVDPGLKPLIDQVNDNAAKIKTNADNIARNSLNVAANTKLINDEIARAKGKESDIVLDVATLSSSLSIVSKGLADETARAKAAEAAVGASVDLTPYAKKSNLAKRIPRTKVWAAAQADLVITGTGQVNDNTASNTIPLEADLDAPVFTYIVPAGTSTIRYTMKNLAIGQRYEFIIKEGIGLASALTLPFAATKTNTPNWRVNRFFFTADKATLDGSFTLSGSSNIQGPAVYSVPGLFVHDENLALNQVAEIADVQSLRNDTDTKINSLSGVVTPMNARITTLEGASGSKRANPAWFNAPRDFDTAYGRKVVDGKSAKTISFDFCAAGESATPMSMTLDTTGWAMSQFWGAPAKFITITPPGGSSMIVAVAAYTDGYVAIGVGAATGNALASVGRVRNVIIDGIIADTL